MAIQIIDGFQINVSAPIDNRIVASGSAARNAIPYKYEGLRVFDLSNGIPYVWYNGAWVSENATGIAGSGNAFYIPRFSSSNIITNSFVYQDGDIIKTDDVGGGVDLIQLDAYYGSVTAQSFVGNGNQITNINGSNVNVGSLPVNRIVNGSNGWLFSGGSGAPAYVNPTQISVGTASVSNTSVIVTNTTNAINYIPFVGSTTNNNPLRAATGLQYNPGTNTLITTNLNASKLNVTNGSLPSSINSRLVAASFSSTTTNGNTLEIFNTRFSTGSTWTSAGYRIQARVDDQYMGYIQFNGSNDTGVSFGTGYMGLTYSSNFMERMRIDISGRVMMNTTSSLSTGCVLHIKSNADLYDGIVHRANNNTNWIFEFQNSSGVARGCIAGNGTSNVVYNTSSDKRLKTNIQDMPSMYDKIKNLKPSKFTWKGDNKEDFGFIAQDVYKVIPSLKSDISDSHCDINNPEFDIENPKRKDGTDYYYSLDYGRFTPYLTKALQETIEKLESLTNKIKTASSLEDLKNSL